MVEAMDTEGAGLTVATAGEGTDMAFSGSPIDKLVFGGRWEDYWKYQIPIVGSYNRLSDNLRFWDDYTKNTGFKPKYPGRVLDRSGGNFNSDVNGARRRLTRFAYGQYSYNKYR